MNETAKRVGAPGLPQVNLVPKEFAEKRAMRAVQVTALFVVLIALGVVVLGYVLALGAKQLAQNDLDDARTAQTEAIAARDAKADVHAAYVQQEIEEFTLAQIGYGEVLYSSFASTVLSTANDSSNFDVLTFSGPSALGLQSLSGDPIFGGGIGSVEFTARTDSYEEATALIGRLEEAPGLAQVRGVAEVYEAAGGNAYWRVEGNAVVTATPLTMRLVPVDGLTGIDPTLFADPEFEPEEEPVSLPSLSPEPTTEEEG
ncbi:hypothetical protein [Demequina aestuarii]|uniref:hypothetical protein n=1 Tax=Demequina aestuarii TaxID=327095 RepID=UPI0007836FA4|nr:hypothetical protein [Demequina aestuarii]